MPDLRSPLAVRPKVVIGHPMLGLGGSESNVMWLIEALKRDFDLTVMTTRGWDLETLNSFYGTQVTPEEVKVRIAPIPWPVRGFSAAALRGACYQRFATQIAPEYDVRISAYNPTDWGMPAIHFIADFSWNKAIREELDPQSPGFIYKSSPLRWAYLKLAAAYLKPSGRDLLRDDVVVANSHWSAGLIKKHFGAMCAAVVYPSVWAEFPEVPWQQKEEAFVMIGRIAPEKRIERAIAILDAVRKRGNRIRLHLCGEIDDSAYGRQITHLCGERADWIVREGRVTGERKAQILASCRFGIQTRAAEPFGISVAEMVKAGAIAFAPNNGGQTEILKHRDILFSDTEDAIEKILALLGNPTLQLKLHAYLMEESKRFSTQFFVSGIRDFMKVAVTPERASALK
jgi:glycosyltransferase involved in cell wall biosynthesis